MKFYAVCPYLFQTVLRPIVRKVLLWLCDLKIIGLENLNEIDGNVILASNHIHELDGFLLPAAIPLFAHPEPLFPVSREPSFYSDKGLRAKLFYGGYFFKFMGAYPAYAGLQDYSKSLQNQLAILEDGNSVLIFPEGKVGNSDFKGGVGYLTLATQKPVVPVVIDGIEDMTFADLIFKGKNMKVKILPPMDPGTNTATEKEISPNNCKRISGIIEKKINSHRASE
jgi:1-acyl-sn-glycerol-3-phosphate acyltransferase